MTTSTTARDRQPAPRASWRARLTARPLKIASALGMVGAWRVAVGTIRGFSTHKVLTLGAALAFFVALSLAPILVVLLTIAGLLGDDVQQRFVQQMTELVGPNAGEALRTVIESARSSRSTGVMSAAVGIGTFVFAATGALGELQESLNVIFGVRAEPGNAIGKWLKKRLLSLALLLVVAFLLLVSLAIETVLQFLLGGEGLGWRIGNRLVSLVITGILFALMFQYLPDARVAWRHTWVGATITAVLFAVGQFAIGKYLGVASIGSSYGAAGSLLVFLVWVYYSSAIVFLGAEVTRVYALQQGARLTPEEHAVRRPATREPPPA